MSSGHRNIASLDELKPGDHISVPGEYYKVKDVSLYRHHMIVKEVRGKDKLLVIHYSSETDKKDMAAVMREERPVDPKKVRLIEYDSGKAYTGEEAVARAEGRCETGKGEYGIFFNNCEHFCTFVKTGTAESKQVQYATMGAGIAAVVGTVALYFLHKPTGSKESEKTSTGKPAEPEKSSASKPSNSKDDDDDDERGSDQKSIKAALDKEPPSINSHT